MNCPNCGTEMVLGLLQSKYPMLWIREKRLLLFVPKHDDDVYLDNIDGINAFAATGVLKTRIVARSARRLLC